MKSLLNDTLIDLCSLNQTSSFLRNRVLNLCAVDYIIQYISRYYIKDQVIVKRYVYESGNRTSIAWYIKATDPTDDTIAFCAHHDVVNPNSSNAFDNMASVAHLLTMIHELTTTNCYRPSNLLFLFTDGEEVGKTGAYGIGPYLRNGPYGNIVHIWNLELTAAGHHLWIDPYNSTQTLGFKKLAKECKKSYVTVRCPTNDAEAFRHMGFNSNCIGTLTRSEIQKFKKHKLFPSSWNKCHSLRDDIAEANIVHMTDFNRFLMELATAPVYTASYNKVMASVVYGDHYE